MGSNKYLGVPLGVRVRRQLGKSKIFRVRRGNGNFGSVSGRAYQDCYNYTVPGSTNNTEGQAARNLLSSAVSNWQYSLSEAEKSAFNERAACGLHMSGFNLYIREFIISNI